LRVGKVIAKKAVCSFFGPPCMLDVAVNSDYRHFSLNKFENPAKINWFCICC